ncbi:MAG TPA: hypothetical protein VKR58_15315 [Aquella sp.]|nr:hypothetical protein [Aquella sp.]
MTIAIDYPNFPRFNVVEYIKKLRAVNFTQEQAEVQAQEMECMMSTISNEIKQELHTDGLATKVDLKDPEVKIEKYRYDSLKFIVWTGAVVTTVILGGVFTMLKLMLHI